MNTAKKIAANTIVQLISKVITVATSLLIVAYLTRYLGVAGYGDYATIFAYVGIFGVFIDLGLFVSSVREIAQNPDRESHIVSNMLGLRLVVGGAVLGAACALSLVFPYSPIIKHGILLAAISQLFISLNQVPVSFFQARLTMHKAAISDVVGRFVLLGLVIWFINLHLGLTAMIWSVTLCNMTVFLLNAALSYKITNLKPQFNLGFWKSMLRSSIPMAIILILGTVYFRIDTIMLSVMKDSTAVGIYGASYKVLEVTLAIPSIFMSSVLPVISQMISKNISSQLHSVLQRSFNVMSLFALPLIAGVVALSTPIILLVAGEEFIKADLVLRVLIFAIGGSFLNSVMIYAVAAANQQRKLLGTYIGAVIFNCVANLIFIPRFSYLGSAVITVATELLVLVLSGLVANRIFKWKPQLTVFMKALFSSAVMFGVLSYIHINLVLSTLIGIAVYAAMITVTKAVTWNEVKSLLSKSPTNV